MPVAITVDPTNAVAKLQGAAPSIKASARLVINEDAVKLWSKVRAKLSNDVLHVRTGNLRSSIQQEVSEDDSTITGRVYSDGSVAYARIQEFGGRIAIPEIVPKNAQALAFEYGGKMVFAKRVRAHTVDIPARSFMRTSLDEFAPQFIADMQKVAMGQ